MNDVSSLIVVMRLSTVQLVRWIFLAGMQFNGILHNPYLLFKGRTPLSDWLSFFVKRDFARFYS